MLWVIDYCTSRTLDGHLLNPLTANFVGHSESGKIIRFRG